MELWDAVENLLAKEPLLLSEVKADQKQVWSCRRAGAAAAWVQS